MADAVYSLALGLAMVAAAAAWLAGLAGRLLAGRRRLWRRRGRWAALAALALALLSLLVHLTFGHRPGGAEAMAPRVFFVAHPALVWVTLAAAAPLLLARPRR